MRGCVAVLVLGCLLTGCGGASTKTAAELRACVGNHLPPGAVDRVFASTEDGVTSINYFRRGSETDLTIFESAAAAEAAEQAEARLGDAHDRRVENVLYSGGGPVERVIVACLS